MIFLRFIVYLLMSVVYFLLLLLSGGAGPGHYHLGSFAKRASKPIAIVFFVIVGSFLLFLLVVALTSTNQ
jgi:hypothetical protein